MFSITEIEMINQYASLLMLPNDIADILEVERSKFISEINDPDSEVRKAFYKGYLLTEVKIRKAAAGETEEGEYVDYIDIDTSKFNSESLNNFKAKLIIQLHA